MLSSDLLNQGYVLALEYGLNLLKAILVLVVGLWAVRISTKLLVTVLDRSEVDDSLKGFLRSLVSILLKIMVYITALGMLGVEMTSFIAILGAAGLAIGMALSGTLQNFAGGVMILLFKPYRVGDFIEAQGYAGTVKEIQIFVTVLTSSDNKTIYIPNGPLATGSLINYSTQPNRRIEWIIGIAYGDDLDKAYELLGHLLGKDERILAEPEPYIGLTELADSSVNITVRAWVASGDFFSVKQQLVEQVYREFEKNGLNIPFPQTDIRIYKP